MFGLLEFETKFFRNSSSLEINRIISSRYGIEFEWRNFYAIIIYFIACHRASTSTMCLSCMINNIDFRVAPTCLKKDTSIILDRHASQLVKTI